MNKFVPLSTARSNAQQAQIQPAIKREDWASLDQRDYNLLQEMAMQSLSTFFFIMGLTKQEKGLEKNYDLTMLLNKLKKHLRRYNLHNVFKIINLNPVATYGSILETLIKLIENYMERFVQYGDSSSQQHALPQMGSGTQLNRPGMVSEVAQKQLWRGSTKQGEQRTHVFRL